MLRWFVDEIVTHVENSIDPIRDAIVITGDHGYAPFDTEVRLNAALPAGWRAYVNGHAAHLYRFGEGPDEAKIVELLTNLRSPDGAPVFESVTRHGAESHPNAGDVIAYTYPRFALSNAASPLFAQVPNYGQHGALNSHPELNTTLGASGVGLTPQRIDVMAQTGVAPLVKELLGLSAAPAASAPARPRP